MEVAVDGRDEVAKRCPAEERVAVPTTAKSILIIHDLSILIKRKPR